MANKTVNGQTLEVPDFDSEKVDIKIGTIMRLLFLIAAYVNQACEVLGAYDSIIPKEYQGFITVASLVATAVASIAAYWFNNSWTPEATVLDKILSTMKYSAKYCPEIKDQIRKNVVDAGQLNAELVQGGNGALYNNNWSPTPAPTDPVSNKDKLQD